MQFEFQPGDDVFIMSRYDGEQKVKVVSQIWYCGEPCYELDRLICANKNGGMVGSKKYEFFEEEYSLPEYTHEPCPEWRLYKDSIKDV